MNYSKIWFLKIDIYSLQLLWALSLGVTSLSGSLTGL